MAHRVERSWALSAAEGGFVAGLAFLAFEVIAGAAVGGVEGLLVPLRVTAAVVLGSHVLDADYSPSTVLVIGTTVHEIFAVAFGILFVVLVQPVSKMRSAGLLLLLAGSYGAALWVTNVLVIAPLAGWTWFTQVRHPSVQVLGHGLAYGLVLGAYLRGYATFSSDAGHARAQRPANDSRVDVAVPRAGSDATAAERGA